MIIVVYGNCQGEVLAAALGQILGNQKAPSTIIFLRNHGSEQDRSAAVARNRDRISRCNVLIEQIITNAPDLEFEVPPTATRLRFPVLRMGWLWPFATRAHPMRPKPVPDHLRDLYPSTVCDNSLDRLLTTGPASERGHSACNEGPLWDGERHRTGAPSPAILDRFFEVARDTAILDDLQTDFPIWPGIEAGFQERRLFWNRTHPTWSFYRGLCERIARALPLDLTDEMIEAGLGRIDAIDPLNRLHAPIHPEVARHFGLKWWAEGMKFRLNPVEGWISYDEYVERYTGFAFDEAAYLGFWQTAHARSRHDLEAAERLLREAVDNRPAAASLRYNLGENLSRQGADRWPEVLHHLEIAERDPDLAADPKVQACLGMVQRRLGKLDAARETFRRLVQLNDAASNRMQSARVLLAMGRFDEAIAEMKAAVDRDPFSAKHLGELGRALVKNRQATEAVGYFKRALALDPDNRELLADSLIARKHAEGIAAVTPVVEAIVLGPGDPMRLVRLCASVLLQAGNMAGALQAYQLLTELDPAKADGWLGLSKVLRGQGDIAAALKWAQEALRHAPDEPSVLCEIGRALTDLGRPLEGIGFLDRAAAAAPENAWFQRQRARTAAILGES